MGHPARKNKMAIVSPGHVLSDKRVFRTYCFFKPGFECYMYFSSECVTFSSLRYFRKAYKDIPVAKLGRWSLGKGKVIDRLWRYCSCLITARLLIKGSYEYIYIHESGGMGVLLSWLVKIATNKTIVIFDYHDWVPLECYLAAKGNKVFYFFLSNLVTKTQKIMLRNIDFIIGISKGHLEWIRKNWKVERTYFTENIYPTSEKSICQGNTLFAPSLVYIGTLMRSRHLEHLISIARELKKDFEELSLNAFGIVLDSEYESYLKNLADKNGLAQSIHFFGGFGSIGEIMPHLSKGAIGFLHPYELNFDIGLNQIASPNKFYSYLALGIPVILHRSFSNIITRTEERACIPYSSPLEVTSILKRLWSNPQQWCRASAHAKESYRKLLKETNSNMMNFADDLKSYSL